MRTLAAIVNRMSYPAALRVGHWTAALAFRLARARVAEACRRIECVFPGKYTLKERRHIAWKSALNMVLIGVEMLRIRHTTPEWIFSVFDGDEAIQRIKSLTSDGRGCIVTVPHMGNWEQAAYACSAHGIPIFTFAAAQRNPLVNDYMTRLRTGPGVDTISRDTGSLREIVRRLKHGHVLAILPDVRMRTPGIQVPFLNGTANLGAGIGMFARLANVPVLPCIVTRVGLDRHVVKAFDLVTSDPAVDKDADIKRMTLEILRLYDREIQRQPEQWFWFNKRWILDPIAPAAVTEG